MNICQNCKYWIRYKLTIHTPKDPSSYIEKWGYFESPDTNVKVQDYKIEYKQSKFGKCSNNCLTHTKSRNDLKNEEIKSSSLLCIDEDSHGHCAKLLTGENFGCIFFEHKI